MDNILTAASVVGILVLALTQLVKQLIPDSKWLPLLNLAIGILLGLVYAATIVGGEYALYGWAGFVAGLAAGGFYDLGANAKGLVNQKRANTMIDIGEGKQDTGDGE